MELNKLIDKINSYILSYRKEHNIDCNSFLVSHISIEPASSTFKAMKVYKLKISLIKEKDIIVLYNNEKIVNSSIVNKEEILNDMITDLFIYVLQESNSIKFNKIIKGESI